MGKITAVLRGTRIYPTLPHFLWFFNLVTIKNLTAFLKYHNRRLQAIICIVKLYNCDTLGGCYKLGKVKYHVSSNLLNFFQYHKDMIIITKDTVFYGISINYLHDFLVSL